jgi:hypothetical protein
VTLQTAEGDEFALEYAPPKPPPAASDEEDDDEKLPR